MVEWLKTHVFIAAWASPIIALIALIWKKSDPNNRVNWSKIVAYVGYLTAFAVVVTPGVDPTVRSYLTSLVVVGFGMLLYDQFR